MSGYILRGEDGIAKARISNRFAENILKSCRGHFKEINYVNDGKKLCFIIDEDMKYGDSSKDLELFFWVGDKLIPE